MNQEIKGCISHSLLNNFLSKQSINRRRLAIELATFGPLAFIDGRLYILYLNGVGGGDAGAGESPPKYACRLSSAQNKNQLLKKKSCSSKKFS